MAVISQLSAARSVYSAAQENMSSLVHVYDKLKDLSGCLFLQTTDDKNKNRFLCWISEMWFEALDFIFPLAATLAATPVNPNSFAWIRIFEDYDGGLEFNWGGLSVIGWDTCQPGNMRKNMPVYWEHLAPTKAV